MYLVRCGNCKRWNSVNNTTPGICFCTRTYFRLKRADSKRIYIYNELGTTSTVWYMDEAQFNVRQVGMKVRMVLVGKDKNVIQVSKGKMLFTKGGKHML